MSDTEPKRGRGRPRRADADSTIVNASAETLAELGYAAFTVDAVADRTGIAKTTIYRRWPTKAALVSAVADATHPLTGETIDALLAEIIAAMRLLERRDAQVAPNATASVVEVLVPFIAARRERIVPLLPPPDAEALADALTGALLIRFISGDGPVDDRYAQILIRRIVGAGV